VGTGIWEWKVLLTIAVHQDKIVAYSFLCKGETMDTEKYIKFLNESLKPYIENNVETPIILQDNASPHTNVRTVAYLFEEGWELLNHPAYSPDLNPCDSEIIAKIKKPLKGKRFANPDEAMTAAADSIWALNNNFSLTGTSNLPGRWQQVVDNNGQYII